MNKTAIVQTLLDNAVGPGNWSRQFNRAEIEVLLEAAIEQVAFDVTHLLMGTSQHGELYARMIAYEIEHGSDS